MQILNLNVIRHTTNFAAMRAFYEQQLGFPIREEWDDAPDNRGVVFTISSGGTLEVLQLGDVPKPGRKPENLDIVVQVDDVRAWYDHLSARGVIIARELEEQDWGHRSFGVDDPDGLRLWFVQHLKAGE